MIILEEIWQPFPDWEGFYEISNLGKVKMLSREILRSDGKVQIFKEKIKKLTPNHKNKYLMVTLTDKRAKRHETKCVHRIVALVYIPNPNNLPEVNHLKTKNDITVNDLEWSTSSDNNKDAYRRGLKISKKDENHSFARKVGRYLNGELLQEYKTMKEAKSDGYDHNSIRQAIENNWKCGGFNWKYLSDRKWIRSSSLKIKKKIGCFKNGVLFKMYEGVDDIKKDGHDKSNIYKALKNENITSGGFVWKYIDEKAA